LTLYWKTLKAPDRDYTLFVHLRDSRGNIIAGRDAPPMLRARPTSQWQPGEIIADFHPMGLPPMPVGPTSVQFEVGFYDATGARLPAFGHDGQEMLGGQAQFGSRELLPASQPLRFGPGEPGNIAEATVASYRLSEPALRRDTPVDLELVIGEVREPVQVMVELWDGPGQRAIWQQEASVTGPGTISMQIAVGSDEPATEGELRVRVRKSDGDNTAMLPWIDEAGHTIDGFAPLTQLTIGPR
jgi:hypothetical protein